MAWLCRCGHSETKPFCSGMHPHVEWDGTETAPRDTYDERALNFPVEGVVLRDDRSLCTHAAFCATSTTDVWTMLGSRTPGPAIGCRR